MKPSSKSSTRSSSSTLDTASTPGDRRSIASASSGTSTLVAEGNSLRSTTPSGQLRKFTAAVGKPGQARETREAVRTCLSTLNPTRKTPISTPLDYETFLTKNLTILENDSQRDLLLFPRDDVTEQSVLAEERTFVPTVTDEHVKEAKWLLTQEALKLYSSPFRILTFNYAQFAGDFNRTNESDSDLPQLLYEIDLAAADEERDLVDCLNRQEVVKEGFLLLAPDAGLLDNFKSGKRRYCVFRRAPDNKLLLEVQKSPGSALTQPALLVDKVQQATKKGKPVLEVTPSESDRKSVVLVAEVDNDIANWVQELDSALNSTSREDTVSTGSAGRGDTESILSDDSRASDGASWRGRNAAARALHPPIVDRRGLFALYADLDPLPEPKGSSSLLAIGESTADVIKLPAEKASVRFAVEFKSLDVKLPVTANKTEQIEPFFLRLFLFDARSGRRLSEEFRVDPNPEAIDALLAKLAGKSSTGDWLGMDQKFVTAKRAYKAIFSVAQPHRDVYLVVRVDRVLSLDASVDAYMKADVRATAKLQKNVGAACLKLGQYRTPFAWGARLVFQEFLGVGAQVPDAMQLYKCDPSKMADSDLQKVLSDFTKAEKAGKLTPITGCSVTLDVDLSAKVNELKYRLSSSLLPLRPWSTPTSADEPVLEMQSFADFREPHSSLFNLLYVYPLSLRYEGQKLFAKARNIVCTVQLVENAGGTPSKAVWDRTDAGGPLVTSSRCAVQHHEQNPTFTEETKLALPVALQPDAHLLFSFAHVSVASAVNAKTAADQAETPVGYAWLPLIKNDKLVLENDEQEFVLSIAADLPAGYVQYQALGLGKGHAGPEIRWVDNGRPLFKVRLRLVSSAFTTEGRLQSFFQSCQKLTRAGTLGDAAEQTKTGGSAMTLTNIEEDASSNMSIRAKALLSVDIDRMTPFLPVVLGRLLSLLPVSSTEEMGLCSLRTLVGIVDKTAESKRAPLLRSFVRLQFRAPNAELAGKSETIHSALCRYVPLLLRPAHADSDTTSGLLRQLWFFLDVTVKSMGQRLLDDGKHKVARTDRFPSELLFRIESMVQTLVPLIIAKHRELPQECRSANAAVAFFLRSCLSLTDRGAVFQWIHFCVDKLDQTESRTVRDYKLELLQILAGHEHWLPLCLPVLCNLAGTVVRKASITSAHDVNAVSASKGSNNSGGFLSRFFAQIFGPATDQDGPSEAERYADCLQDLSLTEEYCSRHFPSGLLVQETLAALRDPRDFRRRAIALLRNVLAKHASDRRYQHPEAQARIATLYAPVLRLVLENLGELEAAAMGGDVPDLSPVGAATAGSIHSSKRSSSLEANSLIRESHSPSPGPPPPPPTAVTVGFAEKLDKGEARDMLLCALFILSRAPKQVLGALWLNDQADELLKLLELALHVFRYRGRKWTMKKTSNKLRATRRTLVLPSSNSATDCLTLDDDDDALPYSVLQESNLTQEVALVILEVAQALKDQVSTRLAGKAEDWDDPWMRLLHLQLSLLADHWPEAVRLHALAALAVFVNAFRARFYRGPLAALSSLIGELLLQLNSRLPAVQRAAAALLQLVLRGGYEAAVLPAAGGGGGGQQALGRPGAQTGVALARLLGQGRPLATSPFFDRGLVALEALVTVQDRRPTPFDRAVQELIGQLRGVLAATGALKESENDPIRLGDLHVRLADSYRGSAALRAAWLESLAGLQTNARWYSEAAVCHAHIVAIIGKELVAKGGMTVDWRLLSAISEAIAGEEAVTDDRADNTQQAGYSVENFTKKIEETVQMLVRAERYEAVGPIYRLAIPIYEQQRNFKALVSVYAELQQAYSRAAETKVSGRRRLASYFRVVFYGQTHFRDDHGTEWIYREPGLTSLAEASERMTAYCHSVLGHDRVQVLGAELDPSTLKETTAYVLMTHVEPLLTDNNEDDHFAVHTNVRRFFFESAVVDDSVAKTAPQVARHGLRRVFLITSKPFPSMQRRQPVTSRGEELLTPLQVACDELGNKAKHLRRILDAVEPGRPLDIKRLQLLLQGAVQPTVNAGPLAYAEAFTAAEQQKRYGQAGTDQLKESFRQLVAVCADALKANQTAIRADQVEYHRMLSESFDVMLDKLYDFFGERLLTKNEGAEETVTPTNEDHPRASMHVFDTIGGVNM